MNKLTDEQAKRLLAFERERELDIIYQSVALEGSTLSKEEVRAILAADKKE